MPRIKHGFVKLAVILFTLNTRCDYLIPYDCYSVTDKIYLYVKDPNEAKCQYLIKKVKTVTFNDWKI